MLPTALEKVKEDRRVVDACSVCRLPSFDPYQENLSYYRSLATNHGPRSILADPHGLPLLGTTRDHVEQGAFAAIGPVAKQSGRLVGEQMARFLDGGNLEAGRPPMETPTGMWLS